MGTSESAQKYSILKHFGESVSYVAMVIQMSHISGYYIRGTLAINLDSISRCNGWLAASANALGSWKWYLSNCQWGASPDYFDCIQVMGWRR